MARSFFLSFLKSKMFLDTFAQNIAKIRDIAESYEDWRLNEGFSQTGSDRRSLWMHSLLHHYYYFTLLMNELETVQFHIKIS